MVTQNERTYLPWLPIPPPPWRQTFQRKTQGWTDGPWTAHHVLYASCMCVSFIYDGIFSKKEDLNCCQSLPHAIGSQVWDHTLNVLIMMQVVACRVLQCLSKDWNSCRLFAPSFEPIYGTGLLQECTPPSSPEIKNCSIALYQMTSFALRQNKGALQVHVQFVRALAIIQ